MTERPILFSGAMVRAILQSQKQQTRRMLRPQPHEDLADTVHYDRATGGAMWASIRGDHGVACPYGKPGDRLWVRETWREDRQSHEDPDREGDLYGYLHRADPDEKDSKRHPWRPSIFMPRAACRLVLEVTGVRVERLQAITEPDAIAEGCFALGDSDCTARRQYEILWDSLNAKRGFGWASNPWVWVIEFRREK